MKKTTIISSILVLAMFLVVMSVTGWAQQDNGGDVLTLDGGKKGNVTFPHRLHQEIESVTCDTCHQTFPQASGSISAMKKAGTLSAKQVMTGLCIQCHKDMASAGKESGPRGCNACHQK